MSTLKSGKKIEIIKGLSTATVAFLADLQEQDLKLRAATEMIKLKKIDQFYNSLTNVSKVAGEVSTELSATLTKLAATWGDRPGMASEAVAEFEEAKAKAASILSAVFTATSVEISNDLDEEYTEETRANFKKALEDFCSTKDSYVVAMSSVIMENTTKDTEAVFHEIGAGLEVLCNSMVEIFEQHSAGLSKFDLGLDSISAEAKKASSNMNAVGESSSRTIGCSEDCLD